jgi:hypothetical protein
MLWREFWILWLRAAILVVSGFSAISLWIYVNMLLGILKAN